MFNLFRVIREFFTEFNLRSTNLGSLFASHNLGGYYKPAKPGGFSEGLTPRVGFYGVVLVELIWAVVIAKTIHYIGTTTGDEWQSVLLTIVAIVLQLTGLIGLFLKSYFEPHTFRRWPGHGYHTYSTVWDWAPKGCILVFWVLTFSLPVWAYYKFSPRGKTLQRQWVSHERS